MLRGAMPLFDRGTPGEAEGTEVGKCLRLPLSLTNKRVSYTAIFVAARAAMRFFTLMLIYWRCRRRQEICSYFAGKMPARKIC